MSIPIPEFWKLAIDSRLISPAEYADLSAAFLRVKGAATQGNSGTLAAWLVSGGVLSQYQARLLQAGRPGPFFFGHYKVFDRIETGRLAGLFRAVHVDSGQLVLLDFLAGAAAQGPQIWAIVVQQAQSTSKMNHPNLTRLFEMVEWNPYRFFVIENLEGKTLAEHIAGRALPLGEAAHIARQVALALVRLSQSGQGHGDVRPGNIWLDPAGGVKLLNFPLARNPLAPAGLTHIADYLAPELTQPGRTADEASDLYSLGCTLYEMLCGQPPFAGGTPPQKIVRHSSEIPLPLAETVGAPAELSRVVATIMAKNSRLRNLTADSLAEALAPFAIATGRRGPASAKPVAAAFESHLRQGGTKKAERSELEDIAAAALGMARDERTEPRGSVQASSAGSTTGASEPFTPTFAQRQPAAMPAAEDMPDFTPLPAATAPSAPAMPLHAPLTPVSPSRTVVATAAFASPGISPSSAITPAAPLPPAPEVDESAAWPPGMGPPTGPSTASPPGNIATNAPSGGTWPRSVYGAGSATSPLAGQAPHATTPTASPDRFASPVDLTPLRTSPAPAMPQPAPVPQPPFSPPMDTPTFASLTSPTTPQPTTMRQAETYSPSSYSMPQHSGTPAIAPSASPFSPHAVAAPLPYRGRGRGGLGWIVFGVLAVLAVVAIVAVMTSGVFQSKSKTTAGGSSRSPVEIPVIPEIKEPRFVNETASVSPTVGKPPASGVKAPTEAMPAPFEPIADDGHTMWMPPTWGEPIDTHYLPAGTELLIALRPAEILAQPEGPKVLEALGPSVALALGRLQAIAGVPNDKVEQLLVAFSPGESDDVPRMAIVIRMTYAVPEATLLAMWGNPAPVKEGEKTRFYQSAERAYYLPPAGKGAVLVIASPAEINEIATSASPSLRGTLERLVKASDASRHFTVLCAPSFLFAGGKTLWSGNLERLRDQVARFLGDDVKGVLLSAQLGADFFVELRAVGSLDQPSDKLAKRYAEQIEQLPARVEDYVVSLQPHPFGKGVLLRFQQVVQKLAQYTRSGEEGKQALLRCYLPGAAGQWLAAGTELSLFERPGGSGDVAAVTVPAKPAGVVDSLNQKMSLGFNKETLEKCMALVSDEIKVEIVILGPDLQLDGITRNQSLVDFNERDKPAKEILKIIMKRANPDGKLVYVVKPKAPGEKEAIFITTRAAAAKRGDKLPPELASDAPAKKK